MARHHRALAILGGLLLACSSPGGASDAVGCEIVAEQVDGTLILRAAIRAGSGQRGSYRLQAVRNHDGRQTTNVSQSATYGGANASQSVVTLSGPGVTDVTLTVSSADGDVVCRRRFESR